MKIAILGYGQMGKAIEAHAKQRGHEVVAIIDKAHRQLVSQLSQTGCEAVIEFTQPEAVVENIRQLVQQGIPAVIGTTGWGAQRAAVHEMALSAGTPVVWAGNYSIGVNILLLVNRVLAKLMERHASYDVYVEERHHAQKRDAPSGTALALAEGILAELTRKHTIAPTGDLASRPPQPAELSIGYARAGAIAGWHQVTYTSETDSLHISHEAYSRAGFALGALMAAEWVVAQPPGLHPFEQCFKEVF